MGSEQCDSLLIGFFYSRSLNLKALILSYIMVIILIGAIQLFLQ